MVGERVVGFGVGQEGTIDVNVVSVRSLLYSHHMHEVPPVTRLDIIYDARDREFFAECRLGRPHISAVSDVTCSMGRDVGLAIS